ncbi:MAG: cytidine deaminase [Kiritimatiellae bacterium]|nr:cytidine deaminase [Kiritimatiellia bacterium]
MKPSDWHDLERAARRAANEAHAPYSAFRVGAAVRTRDGRIFTGANIENASYGLTVCAERVAIWKAVSEGARGFAALAVAAGRKAPVTPCGACLQVLAEFCPPDLPVHCVALPATSKTVKEFVLASLLPHAFTLSGASRKR